MLKAVNKILIIQNLLTDSGENSSKTLKELRDTMKEYCEMEKMMNDAIQAAELVKDEVRCSICLWKL